MNPQYVIIRHARPYRKFSFLLPHEQHADHPGDAGEERAAKQAHEHDLKGDIRDLVNFLSV